MWVADFDRTWLASLSNEQLRALARSIDPDGIWPAKVQPIKDELARREAQK